jgi:hypothetical protein
MPHMQVVLWGLLTTQVSVTSRSLDGENTTLDVQKRHIKSTTTEIVDEDVPLLVGLSGTETVGDSGGGGLVDDAENVEASNGTGVLGGLTLVVVEVGGHGDDGLLNLHAELDLSNLLHLLACQSLPHQSKVCAGRTLTRTMAEISWGENFLRSPRYSTSTRGLPPWSTTLNGHDLMSFVTVSSSNRRPIRRLGKSAH